MRSNNETFSQAGEATSAAQFPAVENEKNQLWEIVKSFARQL
jgi:hypothetical protein